ncbi:guanine nucleotide-binding protein subunit alpha [Coelomomyces lativittatus]|nr:guanine nucleotide-binding protein subunit alpha [Coelomomyces lativittatus]KAJ1506009.1 guanine nucleotide-binding protein subunit alpha [Coelomomyces lativittatus]KAJ1506605.1 guanine nucleotide-binding protein subunit alpha [Coelomomyces lativittatus]
MGCIFSTPTLTPEAIVNAEIDRQLKEDKVTFNKDVKMLLLGTGESGKSTILKQMQLIHGVGYSSEDRKEFKQVIHQNLLQSLRTLVEAVEKCNLSYEKVTKPQLEFFSMASDAHFTKDQVLVLKQFLLENAVQAVFKRANEFQINDSAKYYFESLDRLVASEYMPTDQDILRSRVKTSGIVESTFRIEQNTYRVFDVGGQRSERKKWIHCFENVTAVIFMTALSEYDQKLFEDETMNRMQESLQLFQSICNSRWFSKTSMILFLNKIDLFKDKIAVSPINAIFPEYTGEADYNLACQFFQTKFEGLNLSKDKEVYVHFTCATDTTQIKFVMAAVRDIIMKNNLSNAGLL